MLELLSTLGAQNQALAQAQLSAQQQLAQATIKQPLQAAQALGAGYHWFNIWIPWTNSTQTSPSPTLAQTALGTGATLAGIYRGFGLGQLMKTFRRPMFRKGGNVGTGVMTGIVDRGNYANGDLSLTLNEDDIQGRVDSYRGNQQQSSDPLTDFLLQFGPSLLSATPRGGGGLKGLLSTAGAAAKEPLQDLIKNKEHKEVKILH